MTTEKRKGNTPINVWVTPAEKEAIAASAKMHGLSTSAYLRNIGLNMPVTGKLDQTLILQLSKINGDQGRLGGLLKLWLSNDERLAHYNRDQLVATMEGVLAQIYQMQAELLDKVQKL